MLVTDVTALCPHQCSPEAGESRVVLHGLFDERNHLVDPTLHLSHAEELGAEVRECVRLTCSGAERQCFGDRLFGGIEVAFEHPQPSSGIGNQPFIERLSDPFRLRNEDRECIIHSGEVAGLQRRQTPIVVGKETCCRIAEIVSDLTSLGAPLPSKVEGPGRKRWTRGTSR